MNDLSFKALNIVLSEEKNTYISEYSTNIEYLKTIINNLLNSNSILSKVIQIVKLETSYNSNEYTLSRDCLDFYNISYNSQELNEVIQLLNDIGIHVIQFNDIEMKNFRLIYYLNWEKILPKEQIMKAKQNNRKIFIAKQKFDFKFSK